MRRKSEESVERVKCAEGEQVLCRYLRVVMSK